MLNDSKIIGFVVVGGGRHWVGVVQIVVLNDVNSSRKSLKKLPSIVVKRRE